MPLSKTKRLARKTEKNGKPSSASLKEEDAATFDRRPLTCIPQEVLDEFKGITFLPPVDKPNKLSRSLRRAMEEVMREDERQLA